MNRRKKLGVTILAGLFAGLVAPGALAATTLNFDDIAPSAGTPTIDTPVPETYGGFFWTFPDPDGDGTTANDPAAGTIIDSAYTEVGNLKFNNTYNSPSGSYAMQFFDQFTLTRPGTGGVKGLFTVSSIAASSFAVADKEADFSAGGLSFIGFNNGAKTGQLDFRLSFDKYDLFDLSGLGVIDTLTVLPGAGTSGGTFYVFDDLTFDVAAAPVPVPAAVWLLGSGIGMLFASRRRKAA